MSIEPILLTVTRVSTYLQQQYLTSATGFFFARDERLHLVTSRHVMADPASNHCPDRLEIELHTNRENLAESAGFSLPLYRNGSALWRQGQDNSGDVDVAVIEIQRSALPGGTLYFAFTPQHIPDAANQIEIGTSLLVIGYPLGFHDNLHHLPVARQAVLASSHGLRFQGQGYFLTDARTHRGISGSPVVMKQGHGAPGADLPWLLLGVHSARLDVGTRDLNLDEALGLNCTWYSDALMTLTEG
jgi:S1-C subfamily serine protease